MEQRDLLKRYLDAGVAFTEMTKARAEGIVRELTRAGELQRQEFQNQVEELVQRSRRNTELLRDLMRQEISHQLTQLGLVTKEELDSLERRLTERLAARRGSAATKKAAAKKKAAADKAGPKKAGPKKAGPKKATAKKAAAKKAAGSAKKAAAPPRRV